MSKCFPLAHPWISLPPFLMEDMGIIFLSGAQRAIQSLSLWSCYQPSKAFQADCSGQSSASVRVFFFPFWTWTLCEVRCKAFRLMSVFSHWRRSFCDPLYPAVVLQVYFCTMTDIVKLSNKNLVPKMRLKTQFKFLKTKTFIFGICINLFYFFFFFFKKMCLLSNSCQV